ncbi:hypothetical protein LZD49_27665 [Dyadobacter sp. CY261]|uniref:nuclear transport factor 2 family protein n=1 Tax=Dyadobacter sp. CY261 TaxID=2907203 RepID=UPI001F2F2683|nr:nuclear transport factor 2 family protein [Dyadobacter sp. CY261]MCF0074293.1 hypothetical protein [Dyadobacter sp. CY261]
MTKNEVARKYIEYLSNGAVEQIVGLFAENGTVSSPIYGDKLAKHFFKELTDDTANSRLTLKRIFEDADSNSLALYFEYEWTVKSGKIVVFDVVDILDFNNETKIEKLKIIYDTYVARRLIEDIRSGNS